MPVIDKIDSFLLFLENKLEPICDADPSALARYVTALVKRNKDITELKANCIDSLKVFLNENTDHFVDTLFTAFVNKTYIQETNTSSVDDVMQDVSRNIDESKDSSSIIEQQLAVNHDRSSKDHVSLKRKRKNLTPTMLRDVSPLRQKHTQSPYRQGKGFSPRIRKDSSPSNRLWKDVSPQTKKDSSPQRHPLNRDININRLTAKRTTPLRQMVRQPVSPPRPPLSRELSPRQRGKQIPNFERRRYLSVSDSDDDQGNTKVHAHLKIRRRSPILRRRSPKRFAKRKRGSVRLRSRSPYRSFSPSFPRRSVRLTQNNGNLRCGDFESQGFCVRGETCPFDHGPNPITWERNTVTGGVTGSTESMFNAPPPDLSMLVGHPLMPPMVLQPPFPIPPPSLESQYNQPPPSNLQQFQLTNTPPTSGFSDDLAYNPEAPGYNPEAPGIEWSPPPVRNHLVNLTRDVDNAHQQNLPYKCRGRGGSRLRSPFMSKRQHVLGRGTWKRPQSFVHNASIEVRNIPSELNKISKVSEYFEKFGTIKNVQISFDGDPEGTLVTYSNNNDAMAAISCHDAVMMIPSIKLFWHTTSPETDTSGNTNSVIPKPVGATPKPVIPPPGALSKNNQVTKFKEATIMVGELKKKKYHLLDSQLAEQRKLLKRLESPGLSVENKSTIVKAIKMLDTVVCSLRKQIESSMPVKKSKTDMKKQLLDSEMDLMNGDYTEEERSKLLAKVSRLRQEATAIGLHITPYIRGRSRDSHRGSMKRVTTSHNPYVLTSVDRRPKSIVVSSYDVQFRDDINDHFSQFGMVTDITYTRDGSKCVIIFSTRHEAESAVLNGRQFHGAPLKMDWNLGSKIKIEEKVGDCDEDATVNFADSEGAHASQLEKEIGVQFPTNEHYFGLVNFGNTCYCNSVLQALYFCKPFRDRILQYRPPPKQKVTLLTCLSDLFQNIASQKRKVGVLAPKKFISKLRNENDQFDNLMQQDAHEFLNYLLNVISDIIQAEALEARRRAGEKDLPSPDPTWVQDIFQILSIHLKRFKYMEQLHRHTKLSYRVVFPLELRLFNTSDDAHNPHRLYDLAAIVVHCGSGPNRGHYISIVKSHNFWLLFDDDIVEKIDPATIEEFYGLTSDTHRNSESAYILFYQARDVP